VKIVVTGAAGLTGGRVTELLVAQGHDVTAVVRSETSARLVDSRARIALLDCREIQPLARVVRGDALVHVAGIQLSESVSLACMNGGPGRVIAVSTASAMLTGHPHAAVYLGHEETLRSRRPDATIIRPAMIYGSERDRNVHKVVRFASRWRFLPVPGSGTALIQPIHYDDLARAIVALLNASVGQTVPAAGPTALSLEESARAVFAALEKPAHLIRFPVGPAVGIASLWDQMLGTRLASRLVRTNVDRVVDVAQMTAITGVVPRRFEDGVVALVAEMRSSGSL
jgi:uncharacterized protein YbjT (DUF2867 family)